VLLGQEQLELLVGNTRRWRVLLLCLGHP
jgi:hypothetical protein